MAEFLIFMICIDNLIHFHFFTDSVEIELWEKSIVYMIGHFVKKYGIDHLQEWNFESWNEPDHKIHQTFSRDSYLNYLSATLNGQSISILTQ